MNAPLTATADPRREMPAHGADRLERARAALASLRNEERRLLQLGFEAPLQRCREQMRYWEFLNALCTVAHDGPSRPLDPWNDLSWPPAATR